MAKLYARRINSGIMTIEEVPERWVAATLELLEPFEDNI